MHLESTAATTNVQVHVARHSNAQFQCQCLHDATIQRLPLAGLADEGRCNVCVLSQDLDLGSILPSAVAVNHLEHKTDDMQC